MTDRRGDGGPATPPLEWAVAAVGGLLLVGALGYLAWTAIVGGDGPPALSVRAGAAVEAPGGGYVVPFVAMNAGGSTATAVRVRGALYDDGRAVEDSVVTLDHLPQRSERHGAVQFTGDPASHDLVLRVEGYARP